MENTDLIEASTIFRTELPPRSLARNYSSHNAGNVVTHRVKISSNPFALVPSLLIIASTHFAHIPNLKMVFFKLVTFKAGFTGGQDTKLLSPPQWLFIIFLKLFSEKFLLKMKLEFVASLQWGSRKSPNVSFSLVHPDGSRGNTPDSYPMPGCAYVSLRIFRRKLCLGCMRICTYVRGEEQRTYYRQSCPESGLILASQEPIVKFVVFKLVESRSSAWSWPAWVSPHRRKSRMESPLFSRHQRAMTPASILTGHCVKLAKFLL